MNHFIDPADLAPETAVRLLHKALERKRRRAGRPQGAVDDDAPATGQVLAAIFMRPSTRTRLSFEIAMRQLGGGALILNADDMQLKRGESIADTAKVLSEYVSLLAVRTGSHSELSEWAGAAAVPVINALTAHLHPCQMLADVLTLYEHFGRVAGLQVTWCGDGDNNVCRSWIQASALFGFKLRIAAPEILRSKSFTMPRADVNYYTDPFAAVAGADAVVSDTWISMDCEDPALRMRLLEPYRVTSELMSGAAPHAVFLHCLPAHRGDEVTDAVIDGVQSLVLLEAANRVHAQKAIILYCLGLEQA